MEIIVTYLIVYTTTDDLAGMGIQYNRVLSVLEISYTTGPDELPILGIHIAILCDCPVCDSWRLVHFP
mgnify:CR=1 FL=1